MTLNVCIYYASIYQPFFFFLKLLFPSLKKSRKLPHIYQAIYLYISIRRAFLICLFRFVELSNTDCTKHKTTTTSPTPTILSILVDTQPANIKTIFMKKIHRLLSLSLSLLHTRAFAKLMHTCMHTQSVILYFLPFLSPIPKKLPLSSSLCVNFT